MSGDDSPHLGLNNSDAPDAYSSDYHAGSAEPRPPTDERAHLLGDDYQASSFGSPDMSAPNPDAETNSLGFLSSLTDKYGEPLDGANLRRRARYYIPILGWLPNYTLSNFIIDFLGAVTVSCLLIPQAVSYAGLANLSPVFGLYTAFIPLIIYTILGTCRATNRGFITGVAIVVFVEQLAKAFGLTSAWDPKAATLEKLIFVFKHLDETQWMPVLFSFLGLGALLVFRYIRGRFPNVKALKLFPSILVLMLISELLVWSLDLHNQGLPVLGELEGGFRVPALPKLNSSNVSYATMSAVVITIVGFVESIISAKDMATKNSYPVYDNRELVAYGVGNIINSFFGGYPAFASMTRTTVADDVGVKSPMHGLIASIFVLFTILFLLPMFQWLPLSTLAAIVMYAAYSLLEWHDYFFMWRIRAYSDLAMAAATFLVTVLVSVEIGVFFSILLSIGLVMKEATKPVVRVLGQIDGTDKFKDQTRHPEATQVEGVIVLRVMESLYFANTGLLKDRLYRVEMFGKLESHPSQDKRPVHFTAIIFDIERMHEIDATAVQIMYEVTTAYDKRNIHTYFVRYHEAVFDRMSKAGIVAIPSVHFEPSIRAALDSISSLSGGDGHPKVVVDAAFPAADRSSPVPSVSSASVSPELVGDAPV
ncbi:hypothetical protein H696_00780 [Fonticula alba]|uniref:STAS domain-containing protein n=1 Tax=Fonticula alba TaxID=691883 RepID=A0A058ZFV4_FONAL|nr:hypothetical protein H696_00780 [Fonticula alba]KCV73239.1 hypothetical protein H696_00780 [Fonticula alba]|eukprot:XP_009492940.1 hypothetical protein H696_00780 [Fonticula alba]